ncbi:hypothetical protein [Phaeobacter inhibens]|uniref:hypothetical protein n=1 Tax=Phaeobacter inhibens TaxID=221822 RepID=UPI000AC0CABB|nr:hypothetical protein [Phaeobacter inhibens]WHP67297.1 hypothetical protein QMZ01_12175 [Phaeobacter inhibens]
MAVSEIDVEFEFDEKTDLVVTEVDPDFEPKEPDIEHRMLGGVDGGGDFGFYIGAATGGRRWEMKVLKIVGWPEVKSKTCYKKVKIPFDGWTKVPYPCLWRRTCERSWFLTITHSDPSDLPGNIEEIIKDCAKMALIPAIPILLTGNAAGAAAAFLEAFKTCLLTKGVQQVTKFSVGFDSRAECGPWKRV